MRGDRRGSPGRRRSDLPRPWWLEIPAIAIAAGLGVAVAMALSARAETPPDAVVQAPAVGPASSAPEAEAISPWRSLEALEARVAATTPGELALDDGLAGELLTEFETIHADPRRSDGDNHARVLTLEARLTALGVLRDRR